MGGVGQWTHTHTHTHTHIHQPGITPRREIDTLVHIARRVRDHALPSLAERKWTASIEWRSHAPSGRAHGTYEIEKYEWVSMERK